MSALPPVLIVGSGRSGTTFLGKLLDSHPEVRYRHEPDWAYVNSTLPFLPPKDIPEAFIEQAADYIRALMEIRAPKVSGKTPFFPKAYRSAPLEVLFRLNAMAARLVDRAGLGSKRNLILDMAPRRLLAQATTVIKSVNSVARAPIFAAAFPDIRIIHIVRHPAGVVASRLRGAEQGVMSPTVYIDDIFDAGYTDSWTFGRDEVKRWPIEKQMTFEWMAINEAVFTSLNGNPNYLLVTHESLSRSTMTETKKLVTHAGLQWNEQTENFISSLSADSAQSGYFDIQRSPETQVDTWRQELTPQQVAWVTEIATCSRIGRHLIPTSPMSSPPPAC
ncbi:sulfotransferase family protein [Ectothiorhodospira marina]|uniref:Sulfotransferase family protein n=1 Tax=Ectothiorhodospira marina TaxID=1396821 RepID=A0A1H7I9W4_9GAMM|nr:sulfotransferase [Ectothiorhodospira marina]SEK59228.1 Sulfotransferase family protein [Ectothiorhodospira marina]